MSDILLEVKDLCKTYIRSDGRNVYAVKGIDFKLEKGKSYGLVGESGCGKSTLGQMLVKLLEPTDGKILFEGQDIFTQTKTEEKNFRKKAQIIFQNPYESLNPRMKIKDIMEEPLIIHRIGKNRNERLRMVNEIRTLCGLDPSVMEKYPAELSGGQRQRVSLASSLILKPQFLVLDEAVSSLDVLIQAQILNLLKKMQKSLKLTCLFISHNLNAVSYVADEVFVMYMGTIVERAPVEELLENPIHPYTKALFSAAYNVDNSNERIVLHGDLPNPTEKIKGCPFAGRCPLVQENCREKKPVLNQKDSHFWACPCVES